MSARWLRFAVAVLAAGEGACAATRQEAPSAPLVPPTPKSVTRDHPGGDASDPERAALERLLSQPRGHRGDKFGTLRIPLYDWKNWDRVRLFGTPTRATFQFGKERYAFDALWYTKAEASSSAPESCAAAFEKKARPVVESYGIRVVETKKIESHQETQGERRPMLIKLLEGSVDSILAHDEYVGALAVYDSWSGTCLVRGFAVVATRHKELALKVRDRWISDAATKLAWRPDVHDAPGFDTR